MIERVAEFLSFYRLTIGEQSGYHLEQSRIMRPSLKTNGTSDPSSHRFSCLNRRAAVRRDCQSERGKAHRRRPARAALIR